jgi:hypothetical protein
MVRRLLAAATVALLLAAGVSLPSTAAPMQGKSWVSANNGVVGVQQTIMVKAPALRGQAVTISFQNSIAGNNSGSAAVNQGGFAYLPWTPNLAGAWTISANVGNDTVRTASLTVNSMPTVTTLRVAGELADSQSAGLFASVRALSGSITPSGTVSVRNQSNTVVATGTLVPTSTQGLATAAMFGWTPSAGPTTLTATFIPSTNAFATSVSPSQSPLVGGPQAVSLQLPPVFYVGVEETISAVVQPAFQSDLGGSVAFSLYIDGFPFYPMGGSKSLVGDGGQSTWTPTQAGIQSIRVEYASADFTINGNNTQVINVQPAPTPDRITLASAGGAPLAAANIRVLKPGNLVEFTAASQSGNPVTLSTDGPCGGDGTYITMLGPGTCTITATSLGNGGSLTGTSNSYTITVVDQ